MVRESGPGVRESGTVVLEWVTVVLEWVLSSSRMGTVRRSLSGPGSQNVKPVTLERVLQSLYNTPR